MTEQEKIAQAVTEGYPDKDETCPECKLVFKNYHHFIRCDRRPCPMSCGKTLFEMWAELDQAESPMGRGL
jgi:hypothetical protein